MAARVLLLLGKAAIIGGAMRALVPIFVAAKIGDTSLQIYYLVADVFLLLGICGVYFGTEKPLGLSGAVGFAIFVAGILLVRSGLGGYQIAVAIALLGTTIFATSMLWHGLPKPTPVVWLLAQAAGLASLFVFPTAFVTLSGVLFGLGFVVAGIEQNARLSEHGRANTVAGADLLGPSR